MSAIKKLKCGKAPGIDGLPVEVYSARGDFVAKQLTSLFMRCLEKGIVAQDLGDALSTSTKTKV